MLLHPLGLRPVPRTGTSLTRTIAVGAVVLTVSMMRGDGRTDPLPTGDRGYLEVGRSASVHALDTTLVEAPFEDWLRTTLGSDIPVTWEENDCGEASGSPADTARDLPVCAEASAILSGGRELVVRLAVGTATRGVVPPTELHFAEVEGPDSSVAFHRLGEVREYLDRERPFSRNDSIYLDGTRNVHVITASGKDVRLMKEGPFRDPRLAPDGRTIGMAPISVIEHDAVNGGDPVEVATEVWIYRGGRIARRFEPGGFLRAWSFAGAGDSVAVYSGGLHFAGFYVLYDLETGEERARAEDPVTDDSPEWVRRLEDGP